MIKDSNLLSDQQLKLMPPASRKIVRSMQYALVALKRTIEDKDLASKFSTVEEYREELLKQDFGPDFTKPLDWQGRSLVPTNVQ
jgi:hypothetical protein